MARLHGTYPAWLSRDDLLKTEHVRPELPLAAHPAPPKPLASRPHSRAARNAAAPCCPAAHGYGGARLASAKSPGPASLPTRIASMRRSCRLPEPGVASI